LPKNNRYRQMRSGQRSQHRCVSVLPRRGALLRVHDTRKGIPPSCVARRQSEEVACVLLDDRQRSFSQWGEG
jgi:hypothetical protein